MAKRIKRVDHRYFEVCLGTNPNPDAPENKWVCVKASPLIAPNKEIMTKFLAGQLAEMPGAAVQGICMIDPISASEHYDLSDVANWPVLGGDIETNLF